MLHRWHGRWVAAGLVLLLHLSAARAAAPPPGVADMVERVLPSVVTITTVAQVAAAASEQASAGGAASGQAAAPEKSSGAGFIVDPSGLIVTNAHVVKGAQAIFATLSDGTTLRARVLYVAPVDMAILQVTASRPLAAVTWGDSGRLRRGDTVVLIGNPLGIGTSVSVGVISALDRNIEGSVYDNFLQTDAALNHGNSGGPMFDLAGEVVGMDTALISPGSGSVGLGFAFPGRDVRLILDQWRRFGRARLGTIGVAAQQVSDDVAEAAGLSPPRGAILVSVAPDGPAARAGLRRGDIILQLGGEAIGNPRDLRSAAAAAPPGVASPTQFWRDGATQTAAVTVAETAESSGMRQPPEVAAAARPAGPPTPLHAAELGLHLAPVPQPAGKPAPAGVLVAQVEAGSIASHRGIVAGDVIVQVDDATVVSLETLRQVVGAARAGGRRFVLVLFQRGQRSRWVGMPLFAEEAQ